MDRRTLLKGTAAAAVGAPLASLAMPTSAKAASVYHVAVCEQGRNQILIHPVAPDVDWTPATQLWQWKAPAGDAWNMLSDVKFRNTTAFGWVALVTASGGKVGIVNMGDGDGLLWQATPNGNPHSIERIPDIGVIVTASSETRSPGGYPGCLTIYAPTNSDDPSTLAQVQTIDYEGAHGLWYDGSHLWALGTWTLTQYEVTGSHRDARLVKVWGHTWPDPKHPFNGHGLDTDHSDPNYLLITGGGSVLRVNKSTGALTPMKPSSDGVKSFARIASGESFWQQAVDAKIHWNIFIEFFDSSGNFDRTRKLQGYGYEGQFYKARLSSVDFT
ncbi:hypothetical protein [Streptomyces sp. NBC_00503]|uniref:hypothetical protein n=1 Tax=Streptomyces sp. NBC_00503 TaxID=2903659 RepID=UPI002E82274B|nr:hypothetical protein [Streptomyces sp. NBC_00503]WUD79126.1 hypothetical protein OG490_00120 [Streptomyces sp. NBC_00503]